MNKSNLVVSHFVLRSAGILFVLVGAIFVGASLMAKNEYNQFMQNAVHIEATIESIYKREQLIEDDKVDYEVLVSYELNGVSYNAVLDSYNSSMAEGDVVNAYVIPSKPHNVKTGSKLLQNIFTGIGIAFVSIGIYMTRKSKKTQSTVSGI